MSNMLLSLEVRIKLLVRLNAFLIDVTSINEIDIVKWDRVLGWLLFSICTIDVSIHFISKEKKDC